MLTVEACAGSVERRLAAGDLSCPGCGGILARWGRARPRVLRGPGGRLTRLRPRRARCRGCRVTHVLLAVVALARRADGGGDRRGAGGWCARLRVPLAAAGAGRPPETVRGWLRRFGGRAEAVLVSFTGLLAAVGPDPVMPAVAGSPVADAVAAVAGAAGAVAARWPELGEVAVWQAASAASGGLLLAPGWPPAGCNTS
jgi:hypothetical protein